MNFIPKLERGKSREEMYYRPGSMSTLTREFALNIASRQKYPVQAPARIQEEIAR